MGIIEQWGTGLQRMIQGCKEYGVREPEFIDMGDAFRVNFYRSAAKTGIEMYKDKIKALRRFFGIREWILHVTVQLVWTVTGEEILEASHGTEKAK